MTHARLPEAKAVCPSHLRQSGTKVKGSKTIRYRRSLDRKRYRQEIRGETLSPDPPSIQGKPQVFRF